jgi:hypothetical protein
MPNASAPVGRGDERLSRRAKTVLWLLVSVTLLAVTGVWLFADESLWHFWIITQALPLIYCALTYWGCDAD